MDGLMDGCVRVCVCVCVCRRVCVSVRLGITVPIDPNLNMVLLAVKIVVSGETRYITQSESTSQLSHILRAAVFLFHFRVRPGERLYHE